MSRFAEVQVRIQAAQRWIGEIDADLVGLGRALIDGCEVADTLVECDGLWDPLTSREQARSLDLLVQRAD